MTRQGWLGHRAVGLAGGRGYARRHGGTMARFRVHIDAGPNTYPNRVPPGAFRRSGIGSLYA
jgi:hypothetical protein